MNIQVYAADNVLAIGADIYPCAIGKNGFTPYVQGREGDGKTPLGTYPLRYGLYRADRITPPFCQFQFHEIRKNDGWCDAENDSAYNMPVRLPFHASAEALFRDSNVYDVILVLGHNDQPPQAGLGSAIFMHIARKFYAPTQGCVAVSREDMLEILPRLSTGTEISIKAR